MVACWTVVWEVGEEAVRESLLSWSWSCRVEIVGLAGMNGFSGRGPCQFPFPRWLAWETRAVGSRDP